MSLSKFRTKIIKHLLILLQITFKIFSKLDDFVNVIIYCTIQFSYQLIINTTIEITKKLQVKFLENRFARYNWQYNRIFCSHG